MIVCVRHDGVMTANIPQVIAIAVTQGCHLTRLKRRVKDG